MNSRFAGRRGLPRAGTSHQSSRLGCAHLQLVQQGIETADLKEVAALLLEAENRS